VRPERHRRTPRCAGPPCAGACRRRVHGKQHRVRVLRGVCVRPRLVSQQRGVRRRRCSGAPPAGPVRRRQRALRHLHDFAVRARRWPSGRRALLRLPAPSLRGPPQTQVCLCDPHPCRLARELHPRARGARARAAGRRDSERPAAAAGRHARGERAARRPGLPEILHVLPAPPKEAPLGARRPRGGARCACVASAARPRARSGRRAQRYDTRHPPARPHARTHTGDTQSSRSGPGTGAGRTRRPRHVDDHLMIVCAAGPEKRGTGGVGLTRKQRPPRTACSWLDQHQ